ncbi:MAG: transcription-repair coupling factor [Alphaproteobacteria bacterium]
MIDIDLNQNKQWTLAGCPAGHDARALGELARKAGAAGLIHIATDDMRAASLADQLAFFAPDVTVLEFPAWDCLPYDRVSPSHEIIGRRIATLSDLLHESAAPRLLLTTVSAIAQKIPLPETYRDAGLAMRPGGRLAMEALLGFLAGHGYRRAETVREAGEFAVRGGIVDLFPPGIDHAVRVDFFGDEIETIRSFDPLTQMTVGQLPALDLRPMAEIPGGEAAKEKFRSQYRALFGAVQGADPLYEAVTEGRAFPGMEHWLPLFYERLGTLFDYLPRAAVSYDTHMDESLAARQTQIDDFYQARLTLYQAEKQKRATKMAIVYKPVPPEQLYLAPAALEKMMAVHCRLQLSPFAAAPGDERAVDCGGKLGMDFGAIRNAPAPGGGEAHGIFPALHSYFIGQQKQNKRTALACYSSGARERLLVMAREQGVDMLAAVDSYDALRRLPGNAAGAIILGLDHGFVSGDLAVVTEQDLLGDRLIRAPRKRRAADQFRLELGALDLGDLVVHAEHGIGRYEGLETLHVSGAAHDCLKIIYDGGDKLFVPVENLEVLSRYSSDNSGASLDKLGGVGWQNRRARVKKRLKDMADELLKIAAARELRQGERIEAADGVFHEFCSRFPYMETDDQSQAIEDVAGDLASGKPMDRLICGDVGFGKTEVALRAAFLAAQAGLQVVVVVPTTLLARQHYQNFTRRFAGFPFRIAQLSRFVPVKDAAQTKQEARDGNVDIVIGTHALLAKDMAFKNLGLLIIDEEQHFGVKQKEKLKQLRSEVHVLTLTATPIPRTLQLALAGVRELSLIATPPVDRLAVHTFVLPYDPMVIREAIMREHFRGGQIFYVCPRIEDMAEVERGLRELVPEARMVSAHGRMSPTALEDIMTAFDAGQFDVLLSTNIVESGLDIPNANTLIIHRADMFGLGQLYQLRGRVGRGKQRAYAYFTYAPQQILAQTAQRRLEVIQTLDQLGAGFQLASHDMDIRGSGNLLGEEQSGHIREVGIELYQQMLEDAVAAARAGGAEHVERDWTPQIHLGVPVLIPETYVADLHVRLGLYRRIAGLVDQAEIDGFAAELADRFGKLPDEVENLLHTIAVKQICKQAGIDRVDVGPKGAVISFYQNSFGNPEKLIAWLNKQSGLAKMRPDQKLVLIRTWDDPAGRLRGLRRELTQLAELAA